MYKKGLYTSVFVIYKPYFTSISLVEWYINLGLKKMYLLSFFNATNIAWDFINQKIKGK